MDYTVPDGFMVTEWEEIANDGDVDDQGEPTTPVVRRHWSVRDGSGCVLFAGDDDPDQAQIDSACDDRSGGLARFFGLMAETFGGGIVVQDPKRKKGKHA